MERCTRVLISDPEERKGKWRELMPEAKEVFLELGCGKGRFTAETAAQNPQALYIAVERVPDAMVIAMERVCAQELHNVFFVDGDVAQLPLFFAPGEVDRIYINFCDPWPSNRHAKRRLTHPDFLLRYRQVLAEAGEIHFKTDNRDLFEWSLFQFPRVGFGVSEVTRDLHAGDPDQPLCGYHGPAARSAGASSRGMTAQKGASAVWRKLLYLCSEKRDHPVHEHEVKHRAHKDEQVKNLVTAKAGIIAARPLDGVEHAAHGVENAAAQHPEKAGRGEQAQQGDEGHHSQPAHEDIDAGGEPAGGGDPGQGEHQPGQGQGPDDTEQGPAPGTVGAEHHQADRGIGTGDEEVDRGVVVLAQGDTALDADVAAVIESAGRI